ncbi:MAG: 4'-phosphopantetheinyl transferase superfamily protein [Chloroflexi bacterium]|nr:4'-phosphopantetheinyl transferase superfamily protein [Chloroflexota bacterium]
MRAKTMPIIGQGYIEWLQPPEKPALLSGDLHLWRVDLDQMRETAGLTQSLSPDERARATQLLSDEKRRLFLAGRAALRSILARYLQLLPQAIRFEYLENGKPILAVSKRLLDVRFNLSHSGRWMILGICKDNDVGIDIEEVRPVQKMWALIKLFTDEERKYLADLPENEQDASFITAWTVKEAVSKARGAGLSESLATLVINKDAIGKQTKDGLTFSRTDLHWFIQFELVSGYLGCAAMQTEQQPQISCFEFQPLENSGKSPQ